MNSTSHGCNNGIQAQADATYCITEFGNPDITGIGFRCATYIAVGILLLFLIYGDRKRAWINNAVTMGMIPTIINPGIAFWFLFHGQMDQYTSTVMLHGSLLVNAPQALNLLKFQRRREHRWAYGLNTLLSTIHFCVSYFSKRIQGDKNLNYCTDLQEAIAAFRGERITWTLVALALNIVLTLTDFLVVRRDRIRNRIPPNRLNGERTKRTFPEWLTWNSKDPWNLRRALYCIVAALWFSYSIFQLEYFVIRDFHAYIRHIDGISTIENTWAVGQLSAVFVGGVTGLYLILSFTKEKVRIVKNAKRAAKKNKDTEDPIRTFVRSSSFKCNSDPQSVCEGPSQGDRSGQAVPTTGWRVDSDVEVKSRSSHQTFESQESEIEMQDMGVNGLSYAPNGITSVKKSLLTQRGDFQGALGASTSRKGAGDEQRSGEVSQD